MTHSQARDRYLVSAPWGPPDGAIHEIGVGGFGRGDK